MLNSSVAPEHIFTLTRTAYLLMVVGILTASLTVTGCTPANMTAKTKGEVSSGMPPPLQVAAVEFTDIPMPKRREINLSKTMVVGTNDWFGRVTFDTGQSARNMFKFYAQELSNYGWKKITAVRAHTSLMTYERKNRIMTVSITPNHIHGSEVSIIMSPREQSILPSLAAPPIIRAPLNSSSTPR